MLQAIGAISSIVTVQSDIGASAADIERIAADARLHVHLLPYQHGLRMRILVRPLPNTGAYYAPGSGAERVIADFNGIRTEAKRPANPTGYQTSIVQDMQRTERAAIAEMLVKRPYLRTQADKAATWYETSRRDLKVGA